MTRSSICSSVKECGTKRAHNFLVPKSSFRIQWTTVLGMFKDPAVVLRHSFILWAELHKSVNYCTFYGVYNCWLKCGNISLSSKLKLTLPHGNHRQTAVSIKRTVLTPCSLVQIWQFVFPMCNSPLRSRASSLSRLHDDTQKHHTR